MTLDIVWSYLKYDFWGSNAYKIFFIIYYFMNLFIISCLSSLLKEVISKSKIDIR